MTFSEQSNFIKKNMSKVKLKQKTQAVWNHETGEIVNTTAVVVVGRVGDSDGWDQRM